MLWFAFKLVSLQSHIHCGERTSRCLIVVICFQISIFAESHTLSNWLFTKGISLWFAFKLVSLQSHIHYDECHEYIHRVVICFQISIFAESHTLRKSPFNIARLLWFAFKLVSLQSHIHWDIINYHDEDSCDLLSN